MAKKTEQMQFDALYGELVSDPLADEIGFDVKQRADQDQIVRVLRSRAKGYFDKAQQFEDSGNDALAETYRAVCKELAYLAKAVSDGNLDDLEGKGK